MECHECRGTYGTSPQSVWKPAVVDCSVYPLLALAALFWRCIPDHVASQPYETLAQSDKERYLRESKAYQETKAKAMAELAAKHDTTETDGMMAAAASAGAGAFGAEEVEDTGDSYVNVNGYNSASSVLAMLRSHVL